MMANLFPYISVVYKIYTIICWSFALYVYLTLKAVMVRYYLYMVFYEGEREVVKGKSGMYSLP